MENMVYPVGVQSFEEIRNKNYVYIDKTDIIHRLVTTGDYYFLGRPRRFGKSLLLSTLDAYFSGRRELFRGLAIDGLEPGEWEARPVIHLDLSGKNFGSPGEFTRYVDSLLSRQAEKYGVSTQGYDLNEMMVVIVEEAHRKTGKKVAILIDEYDSPMTRNISHRELQEEIRMEMQSFYSVIKPLSEHIHFCMLTGVTKYGKLSIFSSLNNLKDISLDNRFSTICGITEEELHGCLRPGVEHLAENNGIGVSDAYRELKECYDGYHFSDSLVDVYNPYSLMMALDMGKTGEYWFETGTPTMLVDFLRNPQKEIQSFTGIRVSQEAISSISLLQPQLVALLYQTGYLTIKGYERRRNRYTLDFPNREVSKGFFSSLLPIYAGLQRSETDDVANRILDAVYEGNAEALVENLSAFIAGIPSDLHKYTGNYESHYQLIIYLLFRLIGQSVRAEYETSDGSIDLLLQTDEYIFLIELNVNGSVEDAIGQIERKGYALPFAGDPRRLFRIGICFDSKTHRLSDVLIQ